MKKILIVGAGFAGFLTAKSLAKRFAGKAEITLVDPKDHFLFAPLLIDVLQGDMKPESIRISLSDAAKRFGYQFIQGQVTDIHRELKQAKIETLSEQVTTFSYDVLVLSQGARTNYFGNAEAEKHAFPLKTLKDVSRLRSRIEWAVHEAMSETDTAKRSCLLSFAVVGAGATGIEALCSMQRIAFEAADKMPELRTEMKFHLFQAVTQILPGFPARMVQFALAECSRRGFLVHCGVPVKTVTDSRIECNDGSGYDACCILWSAGLAPNGITASPELPKAGPWLGVDAYLRVADDVFAAGDIVSVSYEKLVVPKNAQTARLMATTLAENVARYIENRADLVPFRYFSKGTLLVMGENGYADFRFFGLPGRWVGSIRKLFYRITFWQMNRG